MEFLFWSDPSDPSDLSESGSPRALEILFEVFTEPTQSTSQSLQSMSSDPSARRARRMRVNDVWSNRNRNRNEPLSSSRQSIDYSEICASENRASDTVIRRVTQPNNSTNFQVQCLNVDSYLAHFRQ